MSPEMLCSIAAIASVTAHGVRMDSPGGPSHDLRPQDGHSDGRGRVSAVGGQHTPHRIPGGAPRGEDPRSGVRLRRGVDPPREAGVLRHRRGHKPQGGRTHAQERQAQPREDRCGGDGRLFRRDREVRYDRLQPPLPPRGRGGASGQGVVGGTGRHGAAPGAPGGRRGPSRGEWEDRHRRILPNGRACPRGDPRGVGPRGPRRAEDVLREAHGPRAQASSTPTSIDGLGG